MARLVRLVATDWERCPPPAARERAETAIVAMSPDEAELLFARLAKALSCQRREPTAAR